MYAIRSYYGSHISWRYNYVMALAGECGGKRVSAVYDLSLVCYKAVLAQYIVSIAFVNQQFSGSKSRGAERYKNGYFDGLSLLNYCFLRFSWSSS